MAAKTKQQVIGLNGATGVPTSPESSAALQQLLAKGAGSGTPTAAGPTGPFAAGAAFQAPSQVTRPPPTVGTPGPYDGLRDTLAQQLGPNVPQSFIDWWVDSQNSQNAASNGGNATPEQIAQLSDPKYLTYAANDVLKKWSALPQGTGDGQGQGTTRQLYVTADQQRTQTINDTATRDAASKYIGDTTRDGGSAVNDFYNNYVTPALKGATTAAGAQVTGDRQAEADYNGLVDQYGNTLDQYQNQRMTGIAGTNAQTTALGQRLTNAVNSTNASNSQLGSQFIPMAQSMSSANSGLAQQLMSAAQSTNANQTGLFNTLSGQASSANSAQNAALSGLLGNVSSSNAQQNQNLAQFQQQFSQLNAQDQKAYLQYLSETDPLMAAMVAQGSDPADVANQRDVVQRYKDLSTPEVTAQERLLGELARRKFESDDQSSREAVMQQLAGRGLKSGGLVIANQQQTAQQLGQDRALAEMGMQANAVGRSMDALQGYSSASTNLRNADDAMRNFQDQYAQNDAVRRGNLATQRNQQSLATTGQVGARDAATYNAATQTVNDNFGRNVTGYNAQTQTINDNYGRDRDVYSAGTQTNQDNYGRTSNAIGTNIGVNSDNYNRNSGAIKDTIGVNQTNLANTGQEVGFNYGVVTDNDKRSQGGIDAGITSAGNKLTAGGNAIQFGTQNRANEAGTAQSLGSLMSGAGASFANVQGGQSGAAIQALVQALGLKDASDLQKLIGQV